MNFDFVVAAFLKYSADKEPLRAAARFSSQCLPRRLFWRSDLPPIV
jgi:hypothetical protein